MADFKKGVKDRVKKNDHPRSWRKTGMLLVFSALGCLVFLLLAGSVSGTGQFLFSHALVLGIIEGITEYLPVSSTGHLLVAQHLMGFTDTPSAKKTADAYAVIIQFGAILAVTGLYRDRVRQMLLGLAGRDPAGLDLAGKLVLAFIPAAVIGLTFNTVIKSYLFGMMPVITGWLAGGAVILLVTETRLFKPSGATRSIDEIRMKQAFIIGLFQVIAMWPGISRSLATILGGLAAGLTLPVAVEFSFLLGLITLCSATAYEMMQSGSQVMLSYGFVLPLAGIISSFAAAWLSVKWLVAYIKDHGLALFGYYRIMLAVIAFILL